MTTTSKSCKACAAVLTSDNWYPSFAKTRNYVCKGCHDAKAKAPKKPSATTAPDRVTMRPFKGGGRANQSQLDYLHARVAWGLETHYMQHERDGTPPSIALIDKTIKFLEKADSTSPARNVGKGDDRLAGLLASYDADEDSAPAIDASVDFRPQPADATPQPMATPDGDRLSDLLKEYVEEDDEST